MTKFFLGFVCYAISWYTWPTGAHCVPFLWDGALIVGMILHYRFWVPVFVGVGAVLFWRSR